MGMYDYIKVHRKWLDIPEESFMSESYKEGDFYVHFQSKDTPSQFMICYEIDKEGFLYKLQKAEWDQEVKTPFGKGGLKYLDIREKVQDFNGELYIYSSLFGSGKSGSGSWPSPRYKDLGRCEIKFDMIDGKVLRARDFVIKEPILKSKEEQDAEKRAKEDKERARLRISPIEWEG